MKVIFAKVNMRYVPEYNLITRIVQNESGIKRVIKTPFDFRALQHLFDLKTASECLPKVISTMDICPCILGDNEVSFDYIEGKTYLSLLKEATSQSPEFYIKTWQAFIALLDPIETVAFRQSEATSKLFGEMTDFIGLPSYPKCAVDLTPSNVLVSEDGKPTMIDYEWWVDQPVPVELIKYHAIYTSWQFHQEIRHSNVSLKDVLEKNSIDETSRTRCDCALHHFYTHIGGNDRAVKPYYLSLPHYVKESVPVGVLGVENRQLTQQNKQLYAQMDAERKIREEMLAGWQKASKSVEILRGQLANNEAEYAKERAETQRQMDEERKIREEMLAGWQEASKSVEILRGQLANNEAEYAKERAETQRQMEEERNSREMLLERNEVSERTILDLRQKLQQSNDSFAALSSQHDISVSEWTMTAERYLQSVQEKNNLEEQLNMLLLSRSWRVTRPFRTMSLVTKRMIGRSARKVYRFAKQAKRKDVPTKNETPQNWPPVEENKATGDIATLDTTAKRIAIYHFFDKDGQVDNYVLYFLKALSQVTEKIIFVSNGSLRKDDEKKVKQYVDDIVIRDNSGFDAWGMKTGIEKIGRRRLLKYDELLLVNSTFFGPVRDLGEVFDGMSSRAVDFWGLASHPGFDFDPFGCNPYGHVPAHVQTYWVAIRKRMFSSEAFWEFWKNLPDIKNYDHAVGLYETVFTRYFSDLGYKWDTWINSSDYIDLTDNPLIATPIETVRDMRCPIIKWRAFFQDYDYLTSFTAQHTASFLMDFIRNHLDYPEDYVWEYLIRTRHMSDLSRNMHLAEILDKNEHTGIEIEEYIKNHPVALFMHLYDEKMAPEMASYACRMPVGAHIWISTTTEAKKKRIHQAFQTLKQKVFVRVCENRGRDVSALLASFSEEVKKYEIICVTHDKKTAYLQPETVGEGFAYMGYENILGSREYVANIIQAFETNPRLGLLYAPDPNHADFATHIGLEWGNNFERCKALADELGLNVPMDIGHPPCAPFGSNFWIRTSALLPLYNKRWTYDDFPQEPLTNTDGTIMHAIERIYPYCAQQAGYYSALLMTTEYSSIEIGNLEFYAQTYAHVCFENGIANRYISVRDVLDQRLGPASTVPETPQQVEQIVASINRFARLKQKIRNKLTAWASL